MFIEWTQMVVYHLPLVIMHHTDNSLYLKYNGDTCFQTYLLEMLKEK